MKGLKIRNQVFPLYECISRHSRRLPLRSFGIQKGQKTWFLTAPCYVWLTIVFLLLALALLPVLAMAAPSLSPDSRWTGFQREQVSSAIDPGSDLSCVPSLSRSRASERSSLAALGPTVRIDPAESVVEVGQAFTVSVMIDQADALGAFEFTLHFTTTAVTVDSVTEGDFPASTERMVIPIGPITDTQAGSVSFGVVTVPPDVPGPDGTGVLATVALAAQGTGESLLDLQDVVVLDTSAGRKTVTVEDGVVRVGFAIYLPLILRDWQK
jgi:hypothetical protein